MGWITAIVTASAGTTGGLPRLGLPLSALPIDFRVTIRLRHTVGPTLWLPPAASLIGKSPPCPPALPFPFVIVPWRLFFIVVQPAPLACPHYSSLVLLKITYIYYVYNNLRYNEYKKKADVARSK